MVGMVPGLAAESRTKSNGLVSGMVVEVQGRSLARAVVKDVLEITWWRGGLESAKLGL